MPALTGKAGAAPKWISSTCQALCVEDNVCVFVCFSGVGGWWVVIGSVSMWVGMNLIRPDRKEGGWEIIKTRVLGRNRGRGGEASGSSLAYVTASHSWGWNVLQWLCLNTWTHTEQRQGRPGRQTKRCTATSPTVLSASLFLNWSYLILNQ